MNIRRAFVCLILFSSLFVSFRVSADEEASNISYVKSGMYGRCYAKCIPDEYYGSKGKTKIYTVQKNDDTLETIYEWYSKDVYLINTACGISVVRMGPWATGHKASQSDLAIGFYMSGKTLKRYSTLDIPAPPETVSPTKSHYTAFKPVIGFRWIKRNVYALDVETNTGKVLSFDVGTGKLITAAGGN